MCPAQAAARGNLPVLKLLIARGATADVPDVQGYTPLRRAAYEGHRDVVRLLLLRKPVAPPPPSPVQSGHVSSIPPY